MAATVKAMKAQGLEVFDFGAGEPAQDTPELVKDAAYQAMQAGFTKYTPVAGCVRRRLRRGVNYDPCWP